MDAAAVVADHSAERIVVVGRRVGAEGQLMLFGGLAQMIEDAPWLDARGLFTGVDLDDLIHEAREVEDNGDVHRLAGNSSAAASRDDRDVVAPANSDGLDD